MSLMPQCTSFESHKGTSRYPRQGLSLSGKALEGGINGMFSPLMYMLTSLHMASVGTFRRALLIDRNICLTVRGLLNFATRSWCLTDLPAKLSSAFCSASERRFLRARFFKAVITMLSFCDSITQFRFPNYIKGLRRIKHEEKEPLAVAFHFGQFFRKPPLMERLLSLLLPKYFLLLIKIREVGSNYQKPSTIKPYPI